MATKQQRTGKKAQAERGITMLEVVVVIAVTAVVAATAAPSLRDLVDARRLDSAATRLAADVQLARSEALTRNRSIRLSIHSGTDASCWIVHTGAVADCGCARGETATCAAPAAALGSVVLPNVERIAITASVASIVFDPLHGTSTPTGTLRVVDARGRAVHHIVNVVGRVRSCTPSGASGYPAC